MVYLLLSLLALASFWFFNSLFQALFKTMRGYHLRRRRELARLFRRQEEEDIIQRLTAPVIKHLLPHFPFKVKRTLQNDLDLIGWTPRLTVLQVQALRLLAWFSGMGAAVPLWAAGKPELKVLAVLAAFAGFFIVDSFILSKVKKVKSGIIAEFPDFVEVVQAKLYADLPLDRAFMESLEHAGPHIRPLLRSFIQDANVVSNMDYALDRLAEKSGLFEVKEFVSLVKLSMDMGDSARDSFGHLADKLRLLKLKLLEARIEKKRMLSLLAPFVPILIILALVGLPTVMQFGNLSKF